MLTDKKAIIFDMDGVLVDSERVYQDAIRTYFTARGIPVTDEEYNIIAGASGQDSRRMFSEWWERATGEKRSGREIDHEVFIEIGGDTFDYATIRNPGVPETLAALKQQGWRLALASSSPKDNIVQVLEQCGIKDCFELLVSGEDFHQSKPDPAIYLHAIDELGLPAEDCIAVEDSDYGITAAKRAGLTVIAKREERFNFTQEGADYLVDEIPGILDVVKG
ncbi:HAD family hydrolase [Enorma phocaeensis]|uniref:HAD family hydrolase n=1 Tax=Enorma phocaeensis TaxID=1871019 RepID=UPI0023555268|nr:HAD family phosphatase [Enorma phocaeensis]